MPHVRSGGDALSMGGKATGSPLSRFSMGGGRKPARQVNFPTLSVGNIHIVKLNDGVDLNVEQLYMNTMWNTMHPR